MYRAIIDLGSNLFQLFIVDKTYQFVRKEEIFVNVGEGGFQDKMIKDSAMKRALDALLVFKKILANYGIETCPLIATSAIRDASNQETFCQLVKQQTGLQVHIISGDEEATYIYQGIRQAKLIRGDSLVVDIGGGSTECIFCNANEIVWKASFPLGVTRLLEQFSPSDPIQPAQVASIERYVEDVTSSFFTPISSVPLTLIGCAGAFETYRNILFASKQAPDEYLEQVTLNLEDVYMLSEQLVYSSKEERRRIKGLSEIRINTVFMGALFIRYLLKRLTITSVIQTDITLKEGVLHAYYK